VVGYDARACKVVVLEGVERKIKEIAIDRYKRSEVFGRADCRKSQGVDKTTV
jgi:hypothetical protein